MQFCRGQTGSCEVCGAPYFGGWQNCPSPRNRNPKMQLTLTAPVAPPEQKKTPCSEPGLAQLAYNYGTAYKKWKRAGKPRRSAEEIERIHAICQACEHFVAGVRPHCGLCGCTCSEGQNPLLNKLAMATEEQCPDNPPRWVSQMPANLVKSGDETNQGT